MNVKERYESAKEIYAAIGVDTDKAVETLENIAISCTAGRATMLPALIRRDLLPEESRLPETIPERQGHRKN